MGNRINQRIVFSSGQQRIMMMNIHRSSRIIPDFTVLLIKKWHMSLQLHTFEMISLASGKAYDHSISFQYISRLDLFIHQITIIVMIPA